MAQTPHTGIRVRKIQLSPSGLIGILDSCLWHTACNMEGTVSLGGGTGSVTTTAASSTMTLTLTAASPSTPKEFVLGQNYPNPFNPATTISFDLPEAARVSIRVYNILGDEVETLSSESLMDAGARQVIFDAHALASGLYFYRVSATGQSTGSRFTDVKKMMLVK